MRINLTHVYEHWLVKDIDITHGARYAYLWYYTVGAYLHLSTITSKNEGFMLDRQFGSLDHSAILTSAVPYYISNTTNQEMFQLSDVHTNGIQLLGVYVACLNWLRTTVWIL
jgi:hypothetical protein